MDGTLTSGAKVAAPAAARQRDGPRRWRPPSILAGAARLARGLLLLALTAVAAVPFALLALVWRLEQGPIELDWLAGHVAPLLAGPGQQVVLDGATLQWRGFSGGPAAGLELRVRSASVRAGGVRRAGLEALSVVLPLAPLLRGAAVPSTVTVGSLDGRLVRDGTGLHLEGAPATDRRDASATQGGHPGWLDGFEGLHVGSATVTLHDDTPGTDTPDEATLRISPLDVRQADGLRAAAAGTASLGPAEARFTLDARRGPMGDTELHLVLAPLDAGTVATALPALVPAGVLDGSVSVRAALHLSPGALPVSLALDASAGPGLVHVRDKQIRFTAATAKVEAGWSTPAWSRPDHIAVTDARAVLPSPGGGPDTTLTGHLRADAAGPITGPITGDAELTLDRIAFADLPALWPSGVAHHVRPWLTGNMTAGTARDASIRLGFEAPADLSAVRLHSVDGRLTGEDLTIWWLRPVPPLEHAAALLTITAPDRLDIAVSTARQGSLALRNGAVRITGLDVKDQFLAVGFDADGAVPELLALLRNPRLNMLSRHPVPARNPAGTVSAHVGVTLPLNHDVRFDQVAITTDAHLTGLHLGGLLAGRDLDGGDVVLDATVDGLRANGQARVGGIPARLSVSMDFRAGGPDQVVQAARLQARADARQLAAAGLDPGPVMDAGTVALSARYEERRSGTARLHATADARAAGLSLLGWRKPPGPAADASATLLLDHGRLAGIEELRATGPGLVLDARVRTIDGRPLELELRRAVLGRTEAAGSLRFPANPGGPVVAQLSGPVLDLSDQFAPDPGAPHPSDQADGTPGNPVIADIRFDRVLLARGTAVPAVAGHAEYDGRRLAALHATTGGPERLEADIRRDGPGRRRATIRAADAGAVLLALDVTDAIRGGTLAAEGVFDDRLPRSPLAGRAELTGFHVGKGVVVGKLLQALTLYGVPDALSGPGVLFDRLLLPFRWDGKVLKVDGARAFSSSLGLTAEGTLDNAAGRVDLRGTVVPAYVLNSLPGRLPGIGRLFSPEQGGGLVALDWSLRGPLDDPAVRVNPLSLLTPGFLRNIFKGGSPP